MRGIGLHPVSSHFLFTHDILANIPHLSYSAYTELASRRVAYRCACTPTKHRVRQHPPARLALHHPSVSPCTTRVPNSRATQPTHPHRGDAHPGTLLTCPRTCTRAPAHAHPVCAATHAQQYHTPIHTRPPRISSSAPSYTAPAPARMRAHQSRGGGQAAACTPARFVCQPARSSTPGPIHPRVGPNVGEPKPAYIRAPARLTFLPNQRHALTRMHARSRCRLSPSARRGAARARARQNAGGIVG